jgi:hypothetical protein
VKALFWVVVCSSLLSGCLSVGYRRAAALEEPAPEAVSRLVEGEAELGQCLAELGAPLYVWPLGDEGRDGAAIVYGWSLRKRWAFDVSLPITRDTSASFQWAGARSGLQGLVLFFDPQWKLLRTERGSLANLLPGEEDLYF